MTSRSNANGRAATPTSPRAQALAVVIVEDLIDERLAGHGGCRYTAPPQPIAEARDLVRPCSVASPLQLIRDRGAARSPEASVSFRYANSRRVIGSDDPPMQ
jgi:hypothetical protein